jgi:hypothetical protein
LHSLKDEMALTQAQRSSMSVALSKLTEATKEYGAPAKWLVTDDGQLPYDFAGRRTNPHPQRSERVSDGAMKLTEVAFAMEQAKKADEVLQFLRQLLGTYLYERDGTVNKVTGYVIAMNEIIQQADQ